MITYLRMHLETIKYSRSERLEGLTCTRPRVIIIPWPEWISQYFFHTFQFSNFNLHKGSRAIQWISPYSTFQFSFLSLCETERRGQWPTGGAPQVMSTSSNARWRTPLPRMTHHSHCFQFHIISKLHKKKFKKFLYIFPLCFL